MIEKGVTGKPQLKEQCLQILLDVFEKTMSFDRTSFIEPLQKGMANKNVKIQTASIQVLIELIDNFGIQHLNNLKDFFPIINGLS